MEVEPSGRPAAAHAAAGAPLLQVRALTKSFPGLRALDGLSFDLHGGEILAIVGQNGSGKSTLVKLLAGVHTADSGAIQVRRPDGVIIDGAGLLEHLHFIHQDLGLIPTLNTIENLDLSRRLGRDALAPLRLREERRKVGELIARFGDLFDINAPIAQLSAAEQRILAIARALSGWTHTDNVLVLDEPTVALPAYEVGRLFDAVRQVARDGVGIIFISHRLDEVLDLADRVIVLRDGRLVANVEANTVDHDELVTLITGLELSEIKVADREGKASAVLSAQHIAGASVVDASLEISAGEIVGVGGIVGSGQEHIAGLLFGAAARERGDISVDGAPLARADPRESIRQGVAFIPADRRGQGAVMEMCARENLTLPWLAPFQRRIGRLDRGAERAEVETWAGRVELSPPEPERPMNLFSGGNQQKVVLAKWLRLQPRVLLLNEPSQGVDVGAKASIYKLIADAAARGTGVLVASSDMKELALLCDRVLIMREGMIAASLQKPEITEANLVSASLGVSKREAQDLFRQRDDRPGDNGVSLASRG